MGYQIKRGLLAFFLTLALLGCFNTQPASPIKTADSQPVALSAEDGFKAKSSDADSIYLPDLRLGGIVNGIDSREAAEFWNNWRIVTARYRPDNGEQRFVYANSIAWKAIERKKSVFPVGSMFAKVAFLTKPDPAFPNSLVPADFARAQLMKKMKTGYESSDNWSYALYLNVTQQQPLGPGELQACHACHRLVPERDYVFSTPTFFSAKRKPTTSMKEKFLRKKLSELNPVVAENLRSLDPHLPDQVHTMEMYLFIGSLQESIGPMTRFAAESGEPYLLQSPKVSHRFFLTVPKPADSKCRAKVALYNSMGESEHEDEEGKKMTYVEVRKGISCDGVFQWDPAPIMLLVSGAK